MPTHLVTIHSCTTENRTRAQAQCATLPASLLAQIAEIAPPWRQIEPPWRDRRPMYAELHRLLRTVGQPAVIWFNPPENAGQITALNEPHEPLEIGRRDPQIEIIARTAYPGVSSAGERRRPSRVGPRGLWWRRLSPSIGFLYLGLLVSLFATKSLGWLIGRWVIAGYVLGVAYLLLFRPLTNKPVQPYLCGGGVLLKQPRVLRGSTVQRFTPDEATLFLRPGVSATQDVDWTATVRTDTGTRDFGVSSLEAVALAALWRSSHRPPPLSNVTLPD